MSSTRDLTEEESFETGDTTEPIPPVDIVAYNELRSCSDLNRLHANGKLEIQPDFQREVVWKSDDQTRFIDSLVKQLPIPSMCFSLDYKTQRWKVIDGLQRMSSIIRFLDKEPWKLSDLSDIHPDLRGASNSELLTGTDQQKRLYSLIEDVSIPVTVIRCDYSQKAHMRYLFTIFHRLNSGGMRLTNQEIRNCIYTSPFNDLLKKFDKSNKDWNAIKRRIWGSVDRYRSVEVLLRVLAFGEALPAYDGNLARFLNDFMADKTALDEKEVNEVEKNLRDMSAAAITALSSERQKKMSLSLIEAVLVGIYVNKLNPNNLSTEKLTNAYKKLSQSAPFLQSARYAISSIENVNARLSTAIHIFSE